MVSLLEKVLTTVTLVRITNYMTTGPYLIAFQAMFDGNGPANFTDIFDEYEEAYVNLTVTAGARVDRNLVDTTARTGYGTTLSRELLMKWPWNTTPLTGSMLRLPRYAVHRLPLIRT